ncbi:MAG: lipase maturation factor family protein [Chloroflexi bacterium]|nr:lipase maturation factor family protein [Chloroflexota bacterium]
MPLEAWFQASDYWLSRWLFERALAAIYVIGFVVAFQQGPALIGERGLLPIPRFVRFVSMRTAPSLFQFRYSDRLLRLVSFVGALVGLATIVGLPQSGPVWLPMLTWFAMWLLYLSIVNVGQIFYAFGWESLLLESGFLAVFLGPADLAPPTPVIWLLRWLLFRLEFGAGLIKLRGDPCWRDGTCLFYHHETQPLPNPLSWYFHRLPRPIHRVEVLGNHVGQLIVPFGLFAPQPVAGVAACVLIALQCWLIVSGNFSWLNFLTLALAFAALDDAQLGAVLPIAHPTLAALAAPPIPFQVVVLAVSALIVVLSYWPARNLLSRHQMMNASFDPFHLVNTYGAFGSVTRERYEVVLAGTTETFPNSATDWREYEFKAKPVATRRWPPQIAPYHLRLDWLMWFAALSGPDQHPWLLTLVRRLLQNDRATLRLLGRNPFPDEPAAWVRVDLYRYRFTTWQERRAGQGCWARTFVSGYLPPLSLRSFRD